METKEKTLLVVDYDQQSLEDLVNFFQNKNFRVLKASDGQTAYEIFKKENPDIVILEAILPKIHGFDLTKKIYQESGGRIPVIIVTGLYKGPQYRHEALTSLGASEYFEKPVDFERLLAAVINLLREEESLEADLPDSHAVISRLAERIMNPYSQIQKKKSI
ncbi:MAG: response regulator [Candidatus Aminicenantes bacterium]|nr:response regulator [Candidatus Aminicenantes bacterium]